MAKQTSTPTIEKDGFVLYRDMVSIANEALPDYHDKGKLFALITQFVNQQPLEDAPERVEMAFKFLKNGIEKNSAKYARKKAAMQAYYEERNKEKSEKEDKSAKSKRAAKNTINNSISTSDSYSDSDSNSDSDSHSNSDSNSKQGIINDTIKENINNNSISHTIIHTVDHVKEVLREREIFFKDNWFMRFYELNEFTYSWKYDIISAAYAFATRYPKSLKEDKKTELPPNCAASPNVAQQVQDITKIDGETAKKVWSNLNTWLNGTSIYDIYNRGKPLYAMKLGFERKYTVCIQLDNKESAAEFRTGFKELLTNYKFRSQCDIGRVLVEVDGKTYQ